MGKRYSRMKKDGPRIDVLTFHTPLGMAILDILKHEANKEDSGLFDSSMLRGERHETTEIFDMFKEDFDKIMHKK